MMMPSGEFAPFITAYATATRKCGRHNTGTTPHRPPWQLAWQCGPRVLDVSGMDARGAVMTDDLRALLKQRGADVDNE